MFEFWDSHFLPGIKAKMPKYIVNFEDGHVYKRLFFFSSFKLFGLKEAET